MDSVFKMLVPRSIYRTTKAFQDKVPCPGKTRAARRRLPFDAKSGRTLNLNKWRRAHAESEPHRARKVQRNLEAMKLALQAHAAYLAIVQRIFGKRKEA